MKEKLPYEPRNRQPQRQPNEPDDGLKTAVPPGKNRKLRADGTAAKDEMPEGKKGQSGRYGLDFIL